MTNTDTIDREIARDVRLPSGRIARIVTRDDVDARLEEAFRSMKRMSVPGTRPTMPNSSAWPEFVSTYWEHFAQLVDPEARAEVESHMRANADYREPPPTAREITRMDEAFKWLTHVEKDDDRRIMGQVYALRAHRVHNAVRAVAKRSGLHRNTVHNRMNRGLENIAKALTVVS